jgi:hypothetical protein
MCLACEQDAIWFAYLESKGLLKADDPAAVEALFGAFPVQPLPMQDSERQDSERQAGAPEMGPKLDRGAAANPFSCDDPAAAGTAGDGGQIPQRRTV